MQDAAPFVQTQNTQTRDLLLGPYYLLWTRKLYIHMYQALKLGIYSELAKTEEAIRVYQQMGLCKL